MKKSLYLYTIVFILLVSLVFLGACSSSNGFTRNDGAAKNEAMYDSMIGSNENDDISSEKGAVSERKILKSYSDVITTKDFKKTLDLLSAALDECGGYIESSDIRSDYSSPYAVFAYRIPSDKAKLFKESVSGSGDLARQTESTEDVTSNYFDTEARLKVLTESRTSITSMLSSAKNVTELLELRRRLDDLNFEIESLTGSLKKWDSLVEMSRYTVRVETVGQSAIISKTPYITQLSNALTGGINGFIFIIGRLLLALAYLIPYLIILAIILTIVLLIYRRKK